MSGIGIFIGLILILILGLDLLAFERSFATFNTLLSKRFAGVLLDFHDFL